MSRLGPTPDTVLAPSEAIPALREVIAPVAEAIDDYLLDSPLPGGADALPVVLATMKARELLFGWRGTAARGFSKENLRALKRADKLFLPVNGELKLKVMFLPVNGELKEMVQPAKPASETMDDLDFQEYIWERLVTEEGLADVRTILAELGPREDERTAPLQPHGKTEAAPTEGDSKSTEGDSKSTEGDKTDETTLTDVVRVLREAGKRNQAALVEFMSDRETATAEEIAERVHRDCHTSEKTMRANANRTNESLAEMGVPLYFRLASGYMFSKSSPE